MENIVGLSIIILVLGGFALIIWLAESADKYRGVGRIGDRIEEVQKRKFREHKYECFRGLDCGGAIKCQYCLDSKKCYEECRCKVEMSIDKMLSAQAAQTEAAE